MSEGEQVAPKGLLHALCLDGTGGASDVPWAEVENWSEEAGTLWLHFDFEEPDTQHWLTTRSGLNDIACHSLINPETRPRTLNRANNLLVTLRGINNNPGQDPEDMVSLRIWTDGRRFISTRRRSLLSTADLLDDLRAGSGPCNATELLVDWAGRITERLDGTLSDFEEEVADIEEQLIADRREGVRESLGDLRRRIIAIRRYLSPQREALNRLVNENLDWIDELNRLRLREVTDRLIRNIEDLDEIRDRAVLAQETHSNRIAEQMNERSYLFTVAAVIFLPLGFLTGLLGINVGGMPGVDDERSFWIVVIMCALLGAGLTMIFRFRRWL